jgi:hypothetical protein
VLFFLNLKGDNRMVVFSREFAILAMFRTASPEQVMQGKAWYDAARNVAIEYARQYGTSKQRAAGVIAALSPQVSWKKNQDYAAIILHGASIGVKPRTYCIQSNWDKAWKIATDKTVLPLDVLSGPKVRAFYRNICGKDDRSVTVDVWAARVAEPYNPKPKLGRTKDYAVIADAYQSVASALGMVPAHLQAACWIVARGTGE